MLAEVLRRYREHAGLTQRGLAHKLEKSQSFVAKIELAMQPIYVWELFDWCAAVGVTPSAVLAEVESLL
jgi:transcriptional regulator with XRE-family HTH domain